MRGRPAGVHHTLRDPLVIEVRDLLTQMVVLEQGRAPRPRFQRVVGVVQPRPLRRGEVLTRWPRAVSGPSTGSPVAVPSAGAR